MVCGTGKFCRDAREQRNLTRTTAAGKGEISINLLRLIEVGVGEPNDLPVIEHYLERIGGEELLVAYKERPEFSAIPKTSVP